MRDEYYITKQFYNSLFGGGIIMKENICTNIICNARKTFMSEEDAKKLADHFEKEVSQSLKTFLEQHPTAAFNVGFAFYIDYDNIDFAHHKCQITEIFTWPRQIERESLNLENPQVTSPSESQAQDVEDGIRTSSLKLFFTELLNRGYNIGYSTDEDVHIHIYINLK